LYLATGRRIPSNNKRSWKRKSKRAWKAERAREQAIRERDERIADEVFEYAVRLMDAQLGSQPEGRNYVGWKREPTVFVGRKVGLKAARRS
jgi:hypothetical protein